MTLNETSDTPPFVFSDKVFNRLKWGTGIVLPACGTLYFALAQIWGLPGGEAILGSIIAVQAFLGVVLGISTKQYNNSDAKFDGTLTTTETPKKKIVSVETNLHPDELAKKDEVLLKVK
jgi:hypothetical protein